MKLIEIDEYHSVGFFGVGWKFYDRIKINPDHVVSIEKTWDVKGGMVQVKLLDRSYFYTTKAEIKQLEDG